MAAVTLQLALSAVIQYREADNVERATWSRSIILYAYFVAESANIVFLPRLAHRLAKLTWAPRADRIAAAFWLAMLVLIFTPFALRYLPSEGRMQSMSGVYIYRAILTASVVHAVAFVFRNLPRLHDRLIRIL